TSASFDTSARTNVASPPARLISPTTDWPSSTRRPETTTLAPALANAIAVAWPMPLVPPVTSATLFLNDDGDDVDVDDAMRTPSNSYTTTPVHRGAHAGAAAARRGSVSFVACTMKI